jgi:hypothetical protein
MDINFEIKHFEKIKELIDENIPVQFIQFFYYVAVRQPAIPADIAREMRQHTTFTTRATLRLGSNYKG